MKNPETLVDTRGYQCPINMAMVSRKIHGIGDGEVLEVRFDDVEMPGELEEWCRETGNRVLEKKHNEDYYSYMILKGPGFKGETLTERIRFIITGVRLHMAKLFMALFGRRKIGYLLTFISIPEGLRAAQWLEQRGEKNYTALPVPRDITSHCGVVLAVESKNDAIKKFMLLKNNNFKVEDIYLIDGKRSVRLEQ